MSHPLYIFGAGGLGREVKAMLLQLPEWSVQGFYDDGYNKGTLCEGIPCVGGLKDLLHTHEDVFVILAIGDPQLKESLVKKLTINKHISFPTLIHPRAILLDLINIKIGEGSIITAGVILTTKIHIGAHTLVNLNATIGHDTVIGNYCSIMPGANLAGEVIIKDTVLIGTGANILNKRCVNSNARVGSGAVVTKDVKPNTTVVGIPAIEID